MTSIFIILAIIATWMLSQTLSEVLFHKRKRRLEMRCVTYAEGDRLIKEGWTLAPEEDGNRGLGMVYVELLEGARPASPYTNVSFENQRKAKEILER